MSTAQLIARLGKEGVPNPAVIAIMAAGAAPRGASDSSYWLLGLTGAEVRAPAEMPKMPSYFTAQDMADPLAFPASSPEMLAKFPPTLVLRSEEHTSELQSLMRISYAVFCLKKKKTITHNHHTKYQRDTHS